MNTTIKPAATTGRAKDLEGKFLTFILGNEAYAIPVLKVREIIRLPTITSVPQMPEWIRGVVNLRGKIIPVMDLRLRFGFTGPTADNMHHCIVVVQVKNPSGMTTVMGLIVDGVEEVTQISAADIEETPSFGVRVSTNCLLGMAKIRGQVKALLDIDRVILSDPIEATAFTVEPAPLSAA